MRMYEKDPRCWVAELSDLEADPMPERVREHLEPIMTIVRWARSYLAQPHPELGRGGPVCPFVRPAMAKGTMFYTVWPGADLDEDEVESVAASFRDFFLELEPRTGREAQYKSINIIFPDLPMSEVGRLIDGTQEKLKLVYTREGIMIGEFHPGPPKKAGLWNKDFRPLRSPLPLLSIRHMVPTDFAFLNDRREFMEAYLAAFGESVPGPLAEQVYNAAERFGLLPDDEEDVLDLDLAAELALEPDLALNPDDCPAGAAVAVAEEEVVRVSAAAAGCPHAAAALAAQQKRVQVGRIVGEDGAVAGD
jgi:hypothetical protein